MKESPFEEFDTYERNSRGSQSRDRETVRPVLERWSRPPGLGRIKKRLRGLFGLSLAIIALQVFVDPGGVTGALLTLWFLLSLPIALFLGLLLLAIREPSRLNDVEQSKTLFGSVGIALLAEFSNAGRKSAVSRAFWQILFGENGPNGDNSFATEDTAVDPEEVSRVRRYVGYAIFGSLALALVDGLVRGGLSNGFDASIPGISSPTEWVALFVGLVLGGLLVGLFLAVRR